MTGNVRSVSVDGSLAGLYGRIYRWFLCLKDHRLSVQIYAFRVSEAELSSFSNGSSTYSTLIPAKEVINELKPCHFWQ